MRTAPPSGEGRTDLRRVLRASPGVVLRLMLVTLAISVVIVAGVIVATVLAAPAAEQVAGVLTAETPVAVLMMVLSGAWVALPIGLMVLGSLLYLGMGLHYADAALRRRRIRAAAALAASLRHFGHGTLVVLILALTLPTVVLPARWALALPETFVVGRNWRDALQESWSLTRGRFWRTALTLVTTLLATAALTVGLTLLGAASGQLWLELGVQWVATTVLVPIPLIVLMVIHRSYGGDGSAELEPIPAGTVFGRMSRGSRSIPAVVSIALVATLFSPVPVAHASEVGAPPLTGVADTSSGDGDDTNARGAAAESVTDTADESGSKPEPSTAPEPSNPDYPGAGDAGADDPDSLPTPPAFGPMMSVAASATVTQTLIDGASPVAWSPWEYGDPTPSTLAGTVTGGSPTGRVQLWGDPKDASGDEVRIGETVELGTGGRFEIDLVTVPPEIAALRVEYLGDAEHLPSRSEWQSVVVWPRMLAVEITTVVPAGPVTVGDEVVLRVEFEPPPPHLSPITGDLELWELMPPGYSHLELRDSADASSGSAQVGFTASARTSWVRLLLAGDPHYEYIDPERPVRADAASTTTTLSTQGVVAPGGTVGAIAQVHAPQGVVPDGVVRFEVNSRLVGSWHTVAEVAPRADGTAKAGFCVGRAADCVDADRKYLTDASSVHLRARYVANPDEADRVLLGSESSPAAIAVDPSVNASGECRLVQLQPRLLGNPHASSAVLGSLGTPSLSPRSNCFNEFWAAAGHRDGSVLTLDARPAPGYQFVEWRHGDRVIGQQTRLVWPLDGDSDHVTLEPVYQPLCLPVQISVEGSGEVVELLPLGTEHPAYANLGGDAGCTRPDGTRGVYPDSYVRIAVRGVQNAQTGEPDVFLGASSNATLIRRIVAASGTAFLTFRVTRSTVVELAFGPLCRFITPVAAATTDVGADASSSLLPEILVAPNCTGVHPATGTSTAGWSRGTELEIIVPDLGEYGVVGGWEVDGVMDPELGASPTLRYTVGDAEAVTIGVAVQRCYPVTTHVSQARGVGGWVRDGRVEVSPAANCPDGSDRWVHGTEVTLRAEGSAQLGAWEDAPRVDDERTASRITYVNRADIGLYASQDDAAAGSAQDSGVRVLAVTAPLETTAHFFVDAACSTITVSSGLWLSEVRLLDDGGCGPGRYWDAAKVRLQRVAAGSEWQRFAPDCAPGRNWLGQFVYSSELDQQTYLCDPASFPYTRVFFSSVRSVNPMSLRDALLRQQAPSAVGGWVATEFAPLSCTGNSCAVNVRGDVSLHVGGCQGIDATVEITVAGDDSGQVYSARDLGMQDFEWVTSDTPGCGDQLAWRAGTEAVLRAVSPTLAFEFLDWSYVENATAVEVFTEQGSGDPRAPLAVRVRTDDAKPTLEAVLRYQVHCASVRAGSWVGIVAPAPNCPGGPTSGAELRYLVGTFLEVVANPINHPDTREFVYFETKVIPGTEGTTRVDPWDLYGVTNPAGWQGGRVAGRYASDFSSAVVLVDQPHKVITGRWQHPDGPFETFFTSTLPQVGKLGVGMLSLATGATLGIVCPPCATALAALQVSEYLVRLLPGGDFLGNIMAMLNPLNFLECSSRWGFNTLDSGGGLPVDEEQLKFNLASAKLTHSMVVRDADALERLNSKTSRVSKLKVLGATAAFATGLYANRIDQFQFIDADAASLRDTAAFEQCLAATYKSPGS